MKIIFVYNADSDFISQAKDFVDKVLSPESYKCNLCKITYGKVKMKQEWKDFIEKAEFDMEFLHKDEFEKKYSEYEGVSFPAVLRSDKGGLELLISSNKINKMDEISDLKEEIKSLI